MRYAMKNRLIILLIPVAASLSCSRANQDCPLSDSDELQTIYASAESGDRSKTVIDNESAEITWTAGDEINVFFGSSESSRFVTSESGKTAKFKGSIDVVTGGGEGLDDDTSLWGVYPYSSSNTCDGNGITLRLPSVQEAAENTFAKGLFPQIARSQNFYMSFYNVCGGVRFSVSNPDICSVTFSGNNGEPVAGTAKISLTLGGAPSVDEIIFGEKELVMNAPDGGCFKPVVTYYFVTYPTVFSGGLTITYHKEDSSASYGISRSVEFKRGAFSRVKDKDAGLTFTPKTLDGWGQGETIGGRI